MLSIGAASDVIVASPAGAVETVVLATPLVSIPKDAVAVLVIAYVMYTANGTTTASTAKLRRGNTTAGLQITTTLPIPVTGGANRFSVIADIDILIGAAQGQWCMTLFEVAAGGNSPINNGVIAAFFLS